MAERYYVPELANSLSEWVLDGDEAHHLLRVRRGKVGDRVQLFNGAGLRAEGQVVEVSKRTARLNLANFRQASAAAGVILGSAPPKGERLLWMIEKCTELGVRSWTPVLSEHTVVHPGDAKIDKLRRKVIEACKQCGRDDLMEIREPIPLSGFLAAKPSTAVGWMLDPAGDSAAGKMDWGCVGPEGGWTEAETAMAEGQGWQLRGLPSHVLRIETACLAASVFALR